MRFGVLVYAAAILFSIGLHEFGHFITAKRFGMKVHQFFIGFGPKVWSVTRGDTEYGVKAIPLGGFVKIAGMNPLEEVRAEDLDRVFKAKPPWQRAIVLSAGSFTHFLLGFLIIASVLMFAGTPETTLALDEIQKGTPAEAAGLRSGDEVRAVAGTPVATWEDVVAIIRKSGGTTIPIVVARDGAERTVEATPLTKRPTGETGGYLGVGSKIVSVKAGPVTAFARAGTDVGVAAKQSLIGFGKLFSPRSFSRIFSQVTGRKERTTEDPATIIGIGGQAGSLVRSGAWASFFMLIAGLNIFIGVANLVPLPPLDGGHLAVLAYEKVRRRDVDMRRLIPVTVTVVAIFGSLFFMLLYLDIVSPLPVAG